METQNKTARKDGQRASEVPGAVTGNGRWRMIRGKGGRIVLRSPDGRVYSGTSDEVRSSALTPERRRSLAEDLRVDWLTTKPGSAERRSCVESHRRDAIMWTYGESFVGIGGCVRLPSALAVKAEAAARALGSTLEEMVVRAAQAAVDAVAVANGGEVPLTRQERAAVLRLGVGAA